jgi:predicted permease
MSPTDARDAANARFGNAIRVRDECHHLARTIEADMRKLEMLDAFKTDVAYALRTFRRSPLFTAVAIITLAIGIGANASIFSVVNAVLLRKLPYTHARETVVVWNHYAATGLEKASIAAPEFADMRDQLTTVEVSALRWSASNLGGDCAAAGEGCDPERVNTYAVSPNLFTVLGAAPALGRPFREEDGGQGADLVVLISDALWRRRFGADPGIVGKSLILGNVPRRVIGVMPRTVRFPDSPIGFDKQQADLWIPFSWERARAGDRGNQNLTVIGRLRGGASLASAQADLDRLSASFRAQFPDRYADVPGGWRLDAVTLSDETVGDAKQGILLLFGAVGLVLLIACANVANLMLARGASREREFAVRASLGAASGRLVRQLLTESAVLGIAGGAVGVALAIAATKMFARLDAAMLFGFGGVRVDGTVLAFTIGISLISGVLFGVAPALQYSRADLHDSLRQGARGAVRGVRRGLRRTLVVAEVALTLVVLVGAGLLARSFAALQRVNTGVTGTSVLTFQVALPAAKYDSARKVLVYHADLRQRIESLPAVEAASIAYPLPMGGEGWGGSYHGTTPEGKEGPELHAEYGVAAPGYFGALGVPLLAGRDFNSSDIRDAPQTVIIDDVLARRHWGSPQNAVGQSLNPNNNTGQFATVIGVVGHVRKGGPRAEGEPQIYLSMLRSPQWRMWYVVRAAGDPRALIASVRAAGKAVDANVALGQVRTMSEVVASATARERFSMTALTIFGVAALVLAAVGLYGVMAYLVTQRVQEIGIRLALGGQPSHVVALVVADGLRMAAYGIVIGLIAAFALSSSLRGLLFGVGETDVGTYAVVAALLGVVAALASYLPARRATRVDPLLTLRGS